MSYQDALLSRLKAMKPSPAPPPWGPLKVISVGGLTEVGFGENSDLLLAVSHNGRGLIDCLTGARIARDRQPLSNDWSDSIRMTAQGIGPLEGKEIRLAGLSGGGLAQTTKDRWSLYVATLEWPDVTVFLNPPGSYILTPQMSANSVKLAYPGAGEFRACGFSPTGKTLVIADSADLFLYFRT